MANVENSLQRVVLGIDMGGTFTKVIVSCEDGHELGSDEFASPKTIDESACCVLGGQFTALLQRFDLAATQVQSIGLAVPGAVGTQEALDFCPNLKLDLPSYQAFLKTIFPLASVSVLNDVDAAVLGDVWRGTASKTACKSVVFVALGTGVGAGLYLNGKLHRSARGAAGEVGHLCVNPLESQACSCGNKGCLEQYASGTGLVRMARNALASQTQEGGTNLVDDQELLQKASEVFPDARAVVEAAARGEEAAERALATFAEALGLGLAQMACVVDPDMFVLGGGVAQGAHEFLPLVKQRFRAHAIAPCADTPIEVSGLEKWCGAYGAAYHAMQKFER